MNRAAAQEILNIVRLPVPPAAIQRLPALRSRDWKRVLAWLDLSGLTLLFWHQLKTTGSDGVVPAQFRARLERNLRDNRARVAAMAEEFDSINQTLENAGIRYAVLKGFALVPEYCPDPSLRTTYDYDYLVSPESMEEAEAALKGAGFVRLKEETGHSITYFHSARPLRRPVDSDEFYSATFPRTIELHRRLWSGDPYEIVCPPMEEDPLSRTSLRGWEGLRYFSLSEEDELVFQLFHAFRHILSDYCRLALLLETAHFLEGRSGDVDFWRRFSDRVIDNRPVSEIAGVILLLVEDLFGVTVPSFVSAITIHRMRKPLALWVHQYGSDAALNNFFSSSKCSLFLHREFVQDEADWREILRRRLFPVHRPCRAARATDSSIRSRWAAAGRQGIYIFRRLIHHSSAIVRYGWESVRWKRLLARSP